MGCMENPYSSPAADLVSRRRQRPSVRWSLWMALFVLLAVVPFAYLRRGVAVPQTQIVLPSCAIQGPSVEFVYGIAGVPVFVVGSTGCSEFWSPLEFDLEPNFPVTACGSRPKPFYIVAFWLIMLTGSIWVRRRRTHVAST